MYTFSVPAALATPPLFSAEPAFTDVGAICNSDAFNASAVDLRSRTLTAANGLSVAALLRLVKNVSPVDVPVLSIAEPMLFTIEPPFFVLPAASSIDTITSLAGTSVPVPSGFVLYVTAPVAGFTTLYTLVPSSLV